MQARDVGDLVVRECVFRENSSSESGGGFSSLSGGLQLLDSTICSNAPDQFSGHFTDGGRNCIQESCIDCDPVQCPADLTGDGFVNGADLGLLFVQWGSCGFDCSGDLTENGVVDAEDLESFLSAWGACP